MRIRGGIYLWLSLFAVLSPASVRAQPPSDEIRLHIEVKNTLVLASSDSEQKFARGPWDLVWRRKGERYVTDDGWEITTGRLRELHTLFGRTSDESTALMEIGFTRERLATLQSELTRGLAAKLPADLNLNWNAVEAKLRAHYFPKPGTYDESNFRIELTLPGPPTKVTNSTSSFTLGLLPWKVEQGEESHLSYGPGAALAILSLLPPLLRVYHHFHFDNSDWEEVLVSEVYRRRPGLLLALLHSQKGFKQVQQELSLPEQLSVGKDLGGSNIRLHLSAKNALIHEFDDVVPLVRGIPVYDWVEAALSIRNLQIAVERQSWLLDWRKARPGRKIQVVEGLTKRTPPVWALSYFGSDALRKLVPPVQLALFDGGEGGNYRGAVNLSLDGSQCLILRALPSH